MKIPNRAIDSGQGVALLLPWLLAIGGIVLGLYVSLRPPAKADVSQLPGTDEEKDVKALRLALATSDAENQALRRELDRVLGVPPTKGPGLASQSGATASAEGGAAQHEVATRLQAALSRLASGDQTAREDVAKAISEALSLKGGAFETLRDAYLSTSDPERRKLLIASLSLSRLPEWQDFLVEQALEEKDPGLRRMLIKQAASYATRDVANRLKSTFIESLGTGEDADLRKAAIRGLRYAGGDGVGDALLRAASDSDEGVRLAAIDTLASRSELRQELADLISHDPSPHVREIGNCNLLIAKEMQKPRRRR